MADNKKNIGPEADKPGEALQEKKAEPVKDTLTAPEQLAPGAPQAPVVETAPKAPPAPTVESKPEEKAAPAPKVLDFSVAKNKAPGKEEAAPEKKPDKEQTEGKPKRSRPAKTDKAPAEKPKQPRDKMSQSKKAPGKEAPIPPKAEEVPKEAKAPEQEQPAAPRDATRSAEPEQIVYIKHQQYIAISIEGQQSTPSLSQAQQLRKLDKEGKLNPDVIDGILSQEKKKEDRNVIINGAELEKYFGKDKLGAWQTAGRNLERS